jgi:uncharacterized protein (UPF0332 family)
MKENVDRPTVSNAALRAILDKAQQKLVVAKVNLDQGFTGDAGDASSRAYYAAFHAVTALLATKGRSFSTHGAAIGAFNQEFVKTQVFPREVASHLHRLFENRQLADYDWRSTITTAEAEKDVVAAHQRVQVCWRLVEEWIAMRPLGG